ncbi:MAG: VWA domain-containing protein [Pseudomonadota bacterium]
MTFPQVLRGHGFAVSPDQTIAFLQGVTLLGPRSIGDIRRAGRALLAIPRDREAEYDAVFDAFFLGHRLPSTMSAAEDDEVEAHEPEGGVSAQDLGEDQPSGQEAAVAEQLGHRLILDHSEAALTRFAREAAARLPLRRAHRLRPVRRGPVLDLRQTLRRAARHDGEVVELAFRRRKSRQRRIVLMVDVSGSMAERTADSLRLAHAVVQAAERCEVVTLGTRLTRITAALRLRRRDLALERASGLIADIDGGTRIGEALRTFLDVPRHAGFARGAAVIVLSDGLERGSPEAVIAAVRRLSRLAWRLDWLTPLAGAGFAPRSEALAAILPDLDHLGDGSGTAAIVDHLLEMARR